MGNERARGGEGRKSVAFVTLGCAKNEVDTEHMRARATGAGYALTDDPETADAIVVNTSRGAVIDNDAVAAALCAGELWGAGIDVFEHEPVSPDAPIMHAPHTVLTSHAAYWSEESAVELRRRCTQNAIDVVLGRTPEACVNPEALPAALAK